MILYSYSELAESERIVEKAKEVDASPTTSQSIRMKSNTPSPSGASGLPDEDIDHLVALHRHRNNSLGSLGVGCIESDMQFNDKTNQKTFLSP